MPQQTIAPPGSSEDGYQTPQNQSNNNAGAAALSVTMPAVAGKTNYVTGYGWSASGATAGSLIDVTITNLVGGTRHHALAIPTGATGSTGVQYFSFNPPLVGTAPNTTVVMTMPSAGAGSVQQSIQLDGYAQ